jgi:uncharacterized CHY-type Zn-finger protein
MIHGEEVYGAVIDDETRCAHYNSHLDVIAIKFKCCGRWFPCRECHDEREKHEAETWPDSEFLNEAVLCGVCGTRMSIDDYLNCDNKCPGCSSKFNPGCANHYHLYFDVGNLSKEQIRPERTR